jgi:hypothetical protein
MSDKKKAVRVSDTAFVTACVAAKSVEELATATGLTKASCQCRANKLRKAGVPLPKYAKAKKALDVAGLSAIVADATKPAGTTGTY